MNSKQTNNLFISTSIIENFTALESMPELGGYSRLLIHALSRCHTKGIENIEYAGRLLAALARKAHLSRRMDVVEYTCQLMLALPLSEEIKNITFFYKALCLKWERDFIKARHLLGQAIETTSPQYRARALQNIGATYYEQGEVDAALPFYLAAGKVAVGCDLLTLAEAQRMIAVVRSIHGDHKRASDDLENLFPLVRTVSRQYPVLYYDYLNSLAVEFGEVDRITEAEAAIRIALRSPFASAYPEWSETREEIEQKRNYPDPSRCFLDRSISESDATTDSTANLSIKADAERATETKPVRASILYQFIGQPIYLKPVTLPIADKAILPGGLVQNFLLQCLGRCLHLRAPLATWFPIKTHY